MNSSGHMPTTASNNAQRCPGWPIILHRSLENTDYYRILRRDHKVRVSDSVSPNSLIFPLSGVAFMLVSLKQAFIHYPPGSESRTLQRELEESIEKFSRVHRRCYLLVLMDSPGQTEQQQLWSLLQARFLLTKLELMPVYNTTDVLEALFSIAKVLCKPVCELMSQRFHCLKAEQYGSEVQTLPLKVLGLTEHQCQVVQDGIGSLSSLASSTEQDLLDCSLDSETAKRIVQFFKY